ncbi:MAG: cytochrome c [Alphaproteobacteria bacterium]|nr:MAG: cytochrome c [Alphaproteobacteria bacterium]
MAALVCAVWAPPLAAASAADIAASPAGDAARGNKVYHGTCIACHGRDGKGAIPGTPDFTDPDGALAKSDAVLLQHMEEGYRSPGALMAMPPKGGDPRLSDQDFRDVLAYLRSAFAKK